MTIANIIGAVTLAITAFGFAALMAALHYAIPVWTGRDLEPPWTYVWGVGFGILTPYVTWCAVYALLAGSFLSIWWTVVALVSICAASGLSVMLCYDRDSKRELAKKAAKGERMLGDDRA